MSNPQLQLQSDSRFHPLDLLDLTPNGLLLKRPDNSGPQRSRQPSDSATGLFVDSARKFAL